MSEHSWATNDGAVRGRATTAIGPTGRPCTAPPSLRTNRQTDRQYPQDRQTDSQPFIHSPISDQIASKIYRQAFLACLPAVTGTSPALGRPPILREVKIHPSIHFAVSTDERHALTGSLTHLRVHSCEHKTHMHHHHHHHHITSSSSSSIVCRHCKMELDWEDTSKEDNTHTWMTWMYG